LYGLISDDNTPDAKPDAAPDLTADVAAPTEPVITPIATPASTAEAEQVVIPVMASDAQLAEHDVALAAKVADHHSFVDDLAEHFSQSTGDFVAERRGPDASVECELVLHGAAKFAADMISRLGRDPQEPNTRFLVGLMVGAIERQLILNSIASAQSITPEPASSKPMPLQSDQ
jgi:hypothetical protein